MLQLAGYKSLSMCYYMNDALVICNVYGFGSSDEVCGMREMSSILPLYTSWGADQVSDSTS